MIPKTYNFKQQYAGDTFNGLAFELDRNLSPIDLTGVIMKMQIRRGSNGQVIKELTTSNGITITDPLAGKFKIDAFVNPSTAYNYVYDLELTYPNGVVDTYIKGFFPIIEDVTR